MLKEAMLYEKKEKDEVHCFLCSHHCNIAPSKFGVCHVRQNRDGTLYTHVYGEAIAANADPIEKKPLYHFLPGTRSFSIATRGCNFQCGFCQNWQISQTTTDGGNRSSVRFSPEDVIRQAKAENCRSIAYTYTEPTIFFEYAHDTARLAKEAGLYNVFVSNGYMTPETVKTARPWLDACNVDLKAFSKKFYLKTCRGKLEPVLDTIRLMRELDIWVEVTTLIVPGQNDSPEELAGIAEFIAETDPEMPWHISRFHPDYEFDSTMPTPVETLNMARDIGKEKGLRYIYMGNVMNASRDTECPQCGETVIRRSMYMGGDPLLNRDRCPSCDAKIAGVFEPE